MVLLRDQFNGVLCQSLASGGRKFRQARKGATVAVQPSAEVQLAGGATPDASKAKWSSAQR